MHGQVYTVVVSVCMDRYTQWWSVYAWSYDYYLEVELLILSYFNSHKEEHHCLFSQQSLILLAGQWEANTSTYTSRH